MYTVRKNTLMKFQLNIELSQPAANLTVLKVTSLLLDYPNHIIRLNKQTNKQPSSGNLNICILTSRKNIREPTVVDEN